MALTNDELSLWELAHRLAGSDPDKRYWFGLPLLVKDNVRMLMNEVLDWNLGSSLIMEKRRPDSEIPSEYFIRDHLDAIYACIAGRKYPKRLLRFIYVDRGEFGYWCEENGHQLPDFWFAYDYKRPDGEPQIEAESTSTTNGSGDPETPRAQLKQLRRRCRETAQAIWRENSDLPIAQVARKIHERNIAKQYGEKSVVKWIRRVAPKSVRDHPGRPKKT